MTNMSFIVKEMLAPVRKRTVQALAETSACKKLIVVLCLANTEFKNKLKILQAAAMSLGTQQKTVIYSK